MSFDSPTTRRGFVLGTGAVIAAVAAPRSRAARVRSVAETATARTYVSRPDLQPPSLTVAARNGPSAGHVFLAPFDLQAAVTGTPSGGQFGALIVDDNGYPIWFRESKPGLTIIDLRVQRYRGQRVLTWYEGHVLDSYGGEWVIADRTYRQIARVKAGNGYRGDLHDCVLTSRGTALITIYGELKADLTSIGGPAVGKVVEGVVQEIDIRSGKVVFEWHSLPDVALEETYTPELGAGGNVDYFHLNSVGVDHDGHLLVSARNTCAVYKLDRKTGAVIWRLGGKRSDFALGPGAAFGYQHDARRHQDGTITLFDNAAFAPGPSGALGPTSRPIRLSLDLPTMVATLVEEYRGVGDRVAFAMGNLQQLPDGSVMVGWGTVGSQTELGRDGTVRWDAAFAQGTATYRAYRSRWVGSPTDPPDATIATAANGRRYVYASWNGATEVDHWRLSAGPDAAGLTRLRTAKRQGFETALALRGAPDRGIAVVEALDRRGTVIGVSQPLTL
ncbi:MAG: arylsulfotransferase family protein [Gaiellales bacterium]